MVASEIVMALHLYRNSDNSLLIDPVMVVFERNDLAIDDIAFPASELQTFERTPVSINVGQIAGNEIADIFALAAHHPQNIHQRELRLR